MEIEEIRSKEKEKLKQLKELRENTESMAEKLQEKKEQFEKEHENEINTINKGKEQIQEVEEELRTLAVSEHKITNEKKLTGGLGIRVLKKVEYEPEKAFKWAMDHKICLQLDKKNFEKLAKSQELDFVEKFEEVTATIPKEINLE